MASAHDRTAPVPTDLLAIELLAAVAALSRPTPTLLTCTRALSSASRLPNTLRAWAHRIVFVLPSTDHDTAAQTPKGTFHFNNAPPVFQCHSNLSRLLQSCLPCQPGDPIHGIVLQSKPGAGLGRLPSGPMTPLQAKTLSLALWLLADQGPYCSQLVVSRQAESGTIQIQLAAMGCTDTDHQQRMGWQPAPDLLHMGVFAVRLGQPHLLCMAIQRLSQLWPNGQFTATQPKLALSHWAKLMLCESMSIASIMQQMQSGRLVDPTLSPVELFLWLAAVDWSLPLFLAIPGAFGLDEGDSVASSFVFMLATSPVLWMICLSTMQLATDSDRITSLMDHILDLEPAFLRTILANASAFRPGLCLCAQSSISSVVNCLLTKYDLPLLDVLKTMASEKSPIVSAILDACFHGNGEYLPVLFENELADAYELGLVMNRAAMYAKDPMGLRTFVEGTSKQMLGEVVCEGSCPDSSRLVTVMLISQHTGINHLPDYVMPTLDYFARMANMLHASDLPFFATLAGNARRWQCASPVDIHKVLFDTPQEQLPCPWDYRKLRDELLLDENAELARTYADILAQIKAQI